MADGNLGLLRAVESYDAGFGVPFGTYAAHWIKQAIRTGLCRHGRQVRVPAHMAALLVRWRRAEAELSSRLGRPPQDREVAEGLRLTQAQARMVRSAQASGRVASLHTPSGGSEGEDEAADVLVSAGPAPSERLSSEEDRRWMQEGLESLDARSSRALALRYGLSDGRERKLAEVGAALGMTREGARRLLLRALATLGDRDRGDV